MPKFTQPSLHVVSDDHVKSAESCTQLSEVTISAAAAATIVAAVRLAASDQGNATQTWAESVDQQSAPSVAAWLYAKIIMTDRYHPTQRGYLPFIYSSAAEAATAFFAQELRSTYPHLGKEVETETYGILTELMLLSGHLPSDYELAWQQLPNKRKTQKSIGRPVLWLGRFLIRSSVNTVVFLWFAVSAMGGARPYHPPRSIDPIIPPRDQPIPQDPKPTTPAVPPTRGSQKRP